MEFIPTIGLEIHAELKTKTKMFCDSLNDPKEKHPNVNICPVCMGYPGVLPVINKEAVKMVLKTGLALGGKLADYTQWDRKNYFYPDLPKGYQISQYKYPLVSGGVLNGLKITRIHLEEETGKLIHEKEDTLVDFNRAGLPLMELVTEPEIASAEQARRFAEELRLVLRYLEVSDADMEKGQMRVEANISISPDSQLGTKIEIKNLNSFKAVEQAINYEIERQSKKLGKREKITQETRGWDENKQKTFSQRSKEEAHDYRYFREPDLPPLNISQIEEFQNLKNELPELPRQKRERLKNEYGLNEKIIFNLVNNIQMADFFEKTISESKADSSKIDRSKIINLTINYINSDLTGIMKEKFLDFDNLLVTPENFADLISMIAEGAISSRVAKGVLKEMVETGAEPHAVVLEKALEQTSDKDELQAVARGVVRQNAKAAEDYKKGSENAIQFLVGQMMKETKGRANPRKAREILEKLLK